MPEESKKNQQKSKNDPKDQRRRRQGRQPVAPVDKKPEKQPERQTEKQSKDSEKPAYIPPGPEFYKNLKRETDEILKITEEANTKYKKKEIQSNWAKYEMPVESYEEIDEQENLGADYEKLIQAPASVGGHFQFKHEKSWDTDTGPSLYDKYFDINMDHLALAVSTIPFYERNSIEKSMFHENDIVTMNHRATKFKHKYNNDNKYNTPELETQAINNDESDMNKIEENAPGEITMSIKENLKILIDSTVKKQQDCAKEQSTALSRPVNEKLNNVIKPVDEIKFKPDFDIPAMANNIVEDNKVLFEDDEITVNENTSKKPDTLTTKVEPSEGIKIDEVIKLTGTTKVESSEGIKVDEDIKLTATTQTTVKKDTPKNPVIESPEDLEKWLDDFLDG